MLHANGVINTSFSDHKSIRFTANDLPDLKREANSRERRLWGTRRAGTDRDVIPKC
jgi:hypothetical protein